MSYPGRSPRCFEGSKLGAERSVPNTVEKSAKGLDRFIQQAIAQGVSAQWEPHFHPKSYGFRPQRSAQEAVRQWQADIHDGDRWVVDLDLEAFFDRVNHDRWIVRLKVAEKAIDKLKDRVRELTRRTRGHRLSDIVAELREALLGWKAHFGIAEALSPLRDIDKWIRRKSRCYHWKQWGRAGYRELRRRGVSVREAWNTSKSAHGPWRLSKTPALALALPARDFSSLGLPSLAAR